MRPRTSLSASGAVAVALALAACGSSSPKSAGTVSTKTRATPPTVARAASPTGPNAIHVQIKGSRLVPAAVKLHLGQFLVWTNADAVTRKLVSQGSTGFGTALLRPHATFTFRPTARGTLRYGVAGVKAAGTISVSR